MSDAGPPVLLGSADRMSDPGWPGVVARVGLRRRVAVNAVGSRYAFQRSEASAFGVRWVGASYATLSALLRVNASSYPGLAEACTGLPERPDLALPAVQVALADLLARFHATDFRREDYPRVICRDGNMRLVVSPDGQLYRVQWIYQWQNAAGACDDWVTQKSSASASELLRWFDVRVYSTDFGEGNPGPDLRAALLALPELASDGVWPAMPERPSASS